MTVWHVTEEGKKCSAGNRDFDVMFPHIATIFSKGDISNPPGIPVASFPIRIFFIVKLYPPKPPCEQA